MEIWKDVKGYEGFYQVSDLGRVRSVDRFVSNRGITKSLVKSQILKQTKNNKGYLYVTLYKDSKGVKKSVHQLMAESFLGHVSDRYTKVIDHIDRNIHNNVLSNLRITTHRFNVSRSMKNATGFRGVHKSGKRYKALIRIKGVRYHLGTFDTPEEASRAYQRSVIEQKPLRK